MQNRRQSSQRQSGFSLIELMVVMIILLAMMAIAIPNMIRGMAIYRLNSAATDVANLIQRTRYEAVRLNRTVACRANLGVLPQEIWIDLDNDNIRDADEPVVLLPSNITFGVAGAPGGASMGLGATQVPPGVISYNARGVIEFGATPPVVFMMTLGDPNDPNLGFKAITVTPVGRTRVWTANPGAGAWH
jgi:prepilin-type N-terminal cleavage/methylation domain-containing protein